MGLTLWHNPRCSKSRAALALLHARGLTPEILLSLKDPPSAEEITALASRLGRPLHEIIRKDEPPYKDHALASVHTARLAQAIATHPILLDRPILGDGTHAVLGRPPEDILDLL